MSEEEEEKEKPGKASAGHSFQKEGVYESDTMKNNVHLTPFTDESTGKAESDRFEEMLEWLRKGGALFPVLHLKYYGIDYRGVHATKDVPTDTEILYVPLSHIMTQDLAKISPIGRQITKSGIQLRCSDTYLASFLLEERLKPDSFWLPYIKCLPRHYRFMPFFFNEEELKYIEGSFSVEKLEERRVSLQKEYEQLCELIPAYRKHRYEEFVWARIAVITRIFGLQIDGHETDGLVPLADMLNHKRPCETTWTYDEAKKGFTITTVKALTQGGQVYDSYGRKCNSRFFVNYGFSLENNEDNQCRVYVKLPKDDPHFQIKERFVSSRPRRFQLPMDYKDKACRPCLSFLRLIHTRDEEVYQLSSSYGLNIRDVQPISLDNELLALQTLSESCLQSLKHFETTLEEDNKLLQDGMDKKIPMSFNVRNAILMRRGEKEVLHYWMKIAKESKVLKSCTSFQQVEEVVEREKLFEGKCASYYYRTVLIPLVKRKEVIGVVQT